MTSLNVFLIIVGIWGAIFLTFIGKLMVEQEKMKQLNEIENTLKQLNDLREIEVETENKEED